MHKYLKLFIFTSLLTLLGCGGVSKTTLTPGGERIEIMHQRPYESCNVVGKFVGENDEGSVELARNHVRNLAARGGADAIIFDEEIRNGHQWRVHATGYKCY